MAPALGQRCPPASGTSAHLAPTGAAGGDGAVLTILQLSSSSPISVAIFYIADPKSLKDLSPPPTFLLSPAPSIQLATSSGMLHRPIALTKSKIIFSPSNLSPPSPSQFYCLLPKPNTWGSCQAHIPHPLPISLQSPWCHLPNSLQVTPFFIYLLGQVLAIRH